MSEQQPEPHEHASTEQEPAEQAPQEPTSQPVAGGADDGPPAQGEGAPDSY